MIRSLISIVTFSCIALVFAGCASLASRASTTQKPSVYFPSGTVNKLEQRWFGSDLAAMKEPILSATGKPAGYFALRILYLPTWRPPVAIRYEAVGNHGTYRAVMLTGQGGYAPGEIKATRTAELSSGDIAKIKQSLEKSGYWSLPDKDGVLGMDGAELVIETVRNGHHRVFVRWEPGASADTRKLQNVVHFLMSQLKATGFPQFMGLTSRSTGHSPAARARAGYLGR